jgi:hypothetical protein
VALFDRLAMNFVDMRRVSKAGISALCWHEAAGAFAAASYDGAIHAVALPDSASAEQGRRHAA